MNIRKNILAIIFCSLSASVATKALAQQSSINHQFAMAVVAALLYLFYRQKQTAYRALVNKIQQSAKEPVIPTNQPDTTDRGIFEELNRLI